MSTNTPTAPAAWTLVTAPHYDSSQSVAALRFRRTDDGPPAPKSGRPQPAALVVRDLMARLAATMRDLPELAALRRLRARRAGEAELSAAAEKAQQAVEAALWNISRRDPNIVGRDILAMVAPLLEQMARW